MRSFMRAVTAVASLSLLALLAVPAGATTARPVRLQRLTGRGSSASSCQLGNGVKHVISIVFDNVHFFRDNPNVPSDLELMPHLKQFLATNGTRLINMHTQLIAHTAEDSLAIYTGLNGVRHGMP